MTLANTIIGVGILAMPYCFNKVINSDINFSHLSFLMRFFFHLFISVRYSVVNFIARSQQSHYQICMLLPLEIIDKSKAQKF